MVCSRETRCTNGRGGGACEGSGSDSALRCQGIRSYEMNKIESKGGGRGPQGNGAFTGGVIEYPLSCPLRKAKYAQFSSSLSFVANASDSKSTFSSTSTSTHPHTSRYRHTHVLARSLSSFLPLSLPACRPACLSLPHSHTHRHTTSLSLSLLLSRERQRSVERASTR